MNWYCLFTPRYEAWAIRLLASAEAHDFDVIPVPYDDRGDWMEGCLWRAGWLWSRSKGGETPIGMLDADQLVLARPELLIDADFKDYDVMTHVREDAGDISKVCAGIIGFGGVQGISTLATWSHRCKVDDRKDLPLREQYYLYQAIVETKARVLDVTDQYNWVEPFGQVGIEPPFGTVLQHGDSRGPAHRKTRRADPGSPSVPTGTAQDHAPLTPDRDVDP